MQALSCATEPTGDVARWRSMAPTSGKNPAGKLRRGTESETPMLVAIQVTEDDQPVRLKLSIVGGFLK